VDGEELLLINLTWASFCRFLLRARAIQQVNIANSNRWTNAATSRVVHCNGILQLLKLQMQMQMQMQNGIVWIQKCAEVIQSELFPPQTFEMDKCSSYSSIISEIEKEFGEGCHERKLKLKQRKKTTAHGNSRQK
jgi:hypothetical protein